MSELLGDLVRNSMTTQSLYKYIANGASLKFEYGPHDCAIWPANWCVQNGHIDPAARWRGKYGEAGAGEFVKKHGMIDLWTLGMIDAGIPEADEPLIGDVGIVECISSDGTNQVGGIFGGKRWHCLSPNGVFQASMPVLKCWRVIDPIREIAKGI